MCRSFDACKLESIWQDDHSSAIYDDEFKIRNKLIVARCVTSRPDIQHT